MMNKDGLIAKQQLEIEHYKAEQAINQATAESLKLMFIAIGAPLNDNVLQFNAAQLGWCRKVFYELEGLEFRNPE